MEFAVSSCRILQLANSVLRHGEVNADCSLQSNQRTIKRYYPFMMPYHCLHFEPGKFPLGIAASRVQEESRPEVGSCEFASGIASTTINASRNLADSRE